MILKSFIFWKTEKRFKIKQTSKIIKSREKSLEDIINRKRN